MTTEKQLKKILEKLEQGTATEEEQLLVFNEYNKILREVKEGLEQLSVENY